MAEHQEPNRSDPQGQEDRLFSRRQFVQRVTMATARAGIATAGLTALAGCQKGEAARDEGSAVVRLAPTHPGEAKERTVDQVGKLPRVQLGTRMGKMEVSRIVIASDWNRDLYGPALALGANFVHKAGYWREMPDEFKKLDRESFYTDATIDSTPNNPDDEDRAYNQVVSSLQSNGLKYYDIFRAHYGWRSVDAFKNQTGTYRAFQRLKREGKVKYFGVSQHATPGDGGYASYPEMIQAEIDSGLIDSMQVWFSAATRPEVMEAFALAHKAGIGLTAMKTFAHGSGVMNGKPELQAQLKAPGKIGRSCVRYALTATSPTVPNGPLFHCCVTALNNLDQFEENMGAVGAKVALADGFIHDA